MLKLMFRATAAGVLFVTATVASADASSRLETLEALVAKGTTVPSISGQTLVKELLDDTKAVQIFDVREPDEYAVSHLARATLVSPTISADDFVKTLPADLTGKTFVFYCSVGRRSSTLGDRVATALQARGAKATYNLTGGIFRWRGLGLPLVNASGPTVDVHPFSSLWKTFLPPAPVVAAPAPLTTAPTSAVVTPAKP